METRQKDFMMRQFNQLAKVIARLLGFKNIEGWEEAVAVANDAYSEILGISSEDLFKKTDDEILSFLKDEKMRLDTMEKFSLFLSEEADIHMALGATDKAKRRLGLALNLMKFIIATDELYVMQRNDYVKSWSDKFQKL